MEERLLSLLRQETVVLQQRLQCPVIEADKMESLVLRTELLYGHLLRIHEGNIVPQLVTENVLEIVRCLVKAIRDAADEIYATGYQAPVLSTGLSGRPRDDLPREQLLHFIIENGFSCNMIS